MQRKKYPGRWTSFVGSSIRGRVVRGLEEEGNPKHRVRVEHNRETLLVHVSGEDGDGWTTVAIDRASRAWAVAQERQQLRAATSAYESLYSTGAAPKMSTPAKCPDEYVDLLKGWPGECVKHLRKNVTSAADLEETLKWGHLVYFSNGPALLIRAEGERVLFGFWRGKRLRDIEPGLKPGGKYEMATLEIRSKPYPSPATIVKLVKEAVKLNRSLGNPQDDAKKK